MIQLLASASVFFALTGTFPAQQPTPQKTVYQPLGPIIGGVTHRQPNTPIPDPESAETVADWPTAMATGTVRDLKGNGAEGIPILLIHEETGQVRRLHTDSKGKYYFWDLPPGTYHLFAGEGPDVKFFQKELVGGTHWVTIISHQPRNFTPSLIRFTKGHDSPSISPPNIISCDMAAIVEAQSPASITTDEETGYVEENIPLQVVEVIRGQVPVKQINYRHSPQSDEGKAPRPGERYLIFFSILGSGAKIITGMIERDEDPARFDRLVSWCRQFVQETSTEQTPPSRIIELLVSGIEDPASEKMASEILELVTTKGNFYQPDDSTEPDSPNRATSRPDAMLKTLKRVAEWEEGQASLVSEIQEERIFSALGRVPSNQPISRYFRWIASKLSQKRLGKILVDRIASVEGLPEEYTLAEIQELASIIRNPELTKLQDLMDQVIPPNRVNPLTAEAQSAKLALFRACRLVARDSIEQLKD